MFAKLLSRYWWLVVLRGVLAILFGVCTFLWPAITIWVLVILFGAYAFTDGVFALFAAFFSRDEQDHFWGMLLGGLIGIAVGIITLFNPFITGLALLFYIAAWSIATGVLQILTAIRLRKEIEGEWALALSGLCGVLFGGLLLVCPVNGALAVTLIIGAYAIIFGALLIAFGWRLKSLGRTAAAAS